MALAHSAKGLGARCSKQFSVLGTVRKASTFGEISKTGGASGYPLVNARYKPSHIAALPALESVEPAAGASKSHWDEEWNQADLSEALSDNVMLTWGPSRPAKDLPMITRAEGVYLYGPDGKKYLDWTSQAVCMNLGHTVPKQVLDAVTKQLSSVPYVYPGMAAVPVRARLSKLLSELTPGDINGFLFPCGGAEANEAAIRMARRYTGRHKVLTQYRSYHGGTASSLGATGDFRRWFTEQGVTGFVKIFNPQPWGFSFGTSDESATQRALHALEEQILLENPSSIAAIMLETVVGAGGVLVPPAGYMQGVRALCDKYEILLILDEVMVGFGRTGKFWCFEHFEGVIPDILTSAKGLSGSFLPLSMVGCREKIRQFFLDEPLGWGATYQAHPVTMTCAYEAVKWSLENKVVDNVARLQPVMMECMNFLVAKHPSVRQARVIGLFGCLDLQGRDGDFIQQLGAPMPPHVAAFKRAMHEAGLIGLFRAPLLHCAPPLIITEEELRDGFQRLSTALDVLDSSI